MNIPGECYLFAFMTHVQVPAVVEAPVKGLIGRHARRAN